MTAAAHPRLHEDFRIGVLAGYTAILSPEGTLLVLSRHTPVAQSPNTLTNVSTLTRLLLHTLSSNHAAMVLKCHEHI